MSSYELNPPKQKGVNLEGLGGWEPVLPLVSCILSFVKVYSCTKLIQTPETLQVSGMYPFWICTRFSGSGTFDIWSTICPGTTRRGFRHGSSSHFQPDENASLGRCWPHDSSSGSLGTFAGQTQPSSNTQCRRLGVVGLQTHAKWHSLQAYSEVVWTIHSPSSQGCPGYTGFTIYVNLLVVSPVNM